MSAEYFFWKEIDRLRRHNENYTEEIKSRKMKVYAAADAIRVHVELRSRSYCTCAGGLSCRGVVQGLL